MLVKRKADEKKLNYRVYFIDVIVVVVPDLIGVYLDPNKILYLECHFNSSVIIAV